MKYLPYIFLIWLLIMNMAGFLSMFLDKRKARRNQWRIKERTLFLVAVLGGSLGSVAGMYVFHHKTKHWYFVIGMPLILILQILLIVWIVCRYL